MTVYYDANQVAYELPAGERINWRVSVYPLVIRDKKVLVIKPRWSEKWELPGGTVELGEKINATLARECYEETGYSIKPANDTPLFIGENNFYIPTLKKFYHSIVMVFPAKLVSETQDKLGINSGEENDEVREVKWLPLSELTEQNSQLMTTWPVIKKIKS
jgi:8-oxo-dGTP pyrophosphatase MutT (NUDIX family)